MMKTILLISMTSLFLIESSASAATCQDILKKIINRQNSPTYLNAEGSVGYGGFSIDVSVLASIPLRIRAKNAKKSLAVLKDAEKGEGPALNEVWKKFSAKHADEAKSLTLAGFAAAIHKSDLDGSACEDDSIPKKRDYIEIADEAAKDCEKPNGTQSLKKVSDEAVQKLETDQ